jgi:hypothetical protein
MSHRILLIAAGLLFLFAIMMTPIPFQTTRGLLALQNAAHPPVFGLIALAALYLIRTSARTRRFRAPLQYFLAWLLSALLGIATEAAQMIGPREPSIADFVNDCLGAVFALSVWGLIELRRARLRHAAALRASLWITAVLGAALMLAPLAWSGAAYLHRNSGLPRLADFGSPLGLYFVMTREANIHPGPGPSDWPRPGDPPSLWVVPTPGPWPGVTIEEPWPDWEGYAALAIDVTNPGGEPLELAIRIDDRWHNDQFRDRYNGRFRVEPRSRLAHRIPIGVIRDAGADRPLDMTAIRRVIIYQSGERPVHPFFLNGLRLER